MNDLNPERWVLACAMLDPWKSWPTIEERLTVEDFADPANRRLFSAFKATSDASEPINPPFIVTKVAKADQSEVAALGRFLTEELVLPAMLPAYLKLLVEARVSRDISAVAESVQSGAEGLAGRMSTIRDGIGAAEQRLRSMTRESKEVVEGTLAKIARDRMHEHLDALASKVKPYVPTALDKLDDAMGYAVSEGDTVVIGALPGHGKTLFTMQCLQRCAEAGRTCVFYSFEMSAAAVGDRVLAMLSEDLRHGPGRLTPAQWERVSDRLDEFREMRNIHFRKVRPNPSVLCADMERMHHEMGATVVAIDYLGLVTIAGQKRYEHQSEAIGMIQSTSASLGITSFVDCQLTRNTEKSKPYIPSMDSLRDSGQIEAAANAIILLRYPIRDPAYRAMERDDLRKAIIPEGMDNMDPQEMYEIRVPKIRNGTPPAGVVVCKFQSSPLRITDTDVTMLANHNPEFDEYNQSQGSEYQEYF